MPSDLELAVILTTFQRPEHLKRSLLSLSLQKEVAGKFEVIVADDGSDDETQSVVRAHTSRAEGGFARVKG